MLFALLAALTLGLAVALLPLSFTLIFSTLLLLPLCGTILLALPAVKHVPYKLLTAVFGLCVFLYFTWPKNVFIPIAALPIKHPQKILYMVFLIAWLVYLIKSAEMRHQFTTSLARNRIIVWIWVGLITWRFLTIFISSEPTHSLFRFSDDFLTYFIVLPIAMTLVRSDADVRLIMNWLLAAAIVTSLLAIPEVIIKKNLFASISTLELVDPVQAQLITAAKFRAGIYRAQSSFDHPLTFSEFLVTVMPWAIAGLLILPKRRWLMALVIVLIGLAMMFTNSRSSFAASMIVAALLLLVAVVRNARLGGSNPWPMISAVLLLPAAIFVIVLFSGSMQEIIKGRTNVEYSSTQARVQMLDRGLPLVKARPLLGYGPGLGAKTLNFTNTFAIITLDNYYLAAALESGIPYVMLLVALALAAVVKCLRTVYDDDPRRAWLYVSIAAGLAGFLAVKVVLGTPLNFPIFYLLVGLACVAGLPNKVNTQRERT